MSQLPQRTPAVVSKPVLASPKTHLQQSVNVPGAPLATSTPAGVRTEPKRDIPSEDVGHEVDESVMKKPQPPQVGAVHSFN